MLVIFFLKFFKVFDRSMLLEGFLRPTFKFYYSQSLDIDFMDIESVFIEDLEVDIVDKNNEQKVYFKLDVKNFLAILIQLSSFWLFDLSRLASIN